MKEKIMGLLKTKKIIIGIAVAIALLVVTFPHTVKTKAISELAGNYTVSYEKYFLHRMVETKTENVCLPGTTVRTRIVSYGLDGDIDMIHIENCDSTSKTVNYAKSGYLKKIENVTFNGDNIRTNVEDYDKNGQIETSTTTVAGNETIITYEYNDDNQLSTMTRIYNVLGLETSKIVSKYTKGDLTTYSYTDSIKNISAELTCKSDGTCELSSFSAVDFDITFNTASNEYDVTANGKTQSTLITSVDETSLIGLILQSETIAEGLKN